MQITLALGGKAKPSNNAPREEDTAAVGKVSRFKGFGLLCGVQANGLKEAKGAPGVITLCKTQEHNLVARQQRRNLVLLRKPTGLICRRTERSAQKNHRAAQTSSGKGKKKRRLPVFQIKPAIKFPADEKQLELPL